MAIKTPLSAQAVKHHLAYSFWKYALLVLAAVVGWNLIYTTTAYRPPADKKIEFYIASSTADTEALEAWMEETRLQFFSDMEQMQAYTILTGTQDAYAQMQLVTYITAGTGDIYLLDAERFRDFAAQEAMLPLEEFVASGALEVEGIDLARGYVTVAETRERYLMGIPADALTGLTSRFRIDPKGTVLCVMARSGNQENAIKFMAHILTHFQGPAAD